MLEEVANLQKYFMKEIIDDTQMTIREFSEFYKIPYNTVLQWYKGKRKASEWLKRLFKEDIKHRTKGEQIEWKINIKNLQYTIIINYRNEYGRHILIQEGFLSNETARNWANKNAQAINEDENAVLESMYIKTTFTEKID